MKDFSIPPCIISDIKKFEDVFKREITTNTTLLNIITSYILKTKGKQLRPILVFLSARMCGAITESTYSAAYMVELLHTATLLHDDVVDNAEKRRGFFSINALWKNKIAVLVGDYFLAKGLLHAIEKHEIEILGIISNAVKEMSEGELLQVEKSRKLNNTEEIYFEIIRKKTAALFVAAMTAGAVSSMQCNDEQKASIKKIAEILGVAFQIKDDILDYTSTNIIGKPAWNDLKEQKITLPLLHALSQVPKSEQRRIKHLLKKHKNKHGKLKEIVDFVTAFGGIEYAQQTIDTMCKEAIELTSVFSQNESRDAMIELIQFVSTRIK